MSNRYADDERRRRLCVITLQVKTDHLNLPLRRHNLGSNGRASQAYFVYDLSCVAVEPHVRSAEKIFNMAYFGKKLFLRHHD